MNSVGCVPTATSITSAQRHRFKEDKLNANTWLLDNFELSRNERFMNVRMFSTCTIRYDFARGTQTNRSINSFIDCLSDCFAGKFP